MIQCQDCEYFSRGPDGQLAFRCDPFSTIKEPECLAKWQLIKLDVMVQAYQATLSMYKRMAPLQEKLIRRMEREVEEMDDADSWKNSEDEPEEGDESADEDGAW